MKRLLLAGLLLTAACGTGEAASGDAVTNSTESVCDEFAAHAKAGLPEGERAGIVQSIGEVIANADQPVRDAFPALERSLKTPTAYQMGADTFANGCFAAGWKG